MDVVIMWKRGWTPSTVFENVKSFAEASDLVDQAVIKFGSAESIEVYENKKLIACLRTMR